MVNNKGQIDKGIRHILSSPYFYDFFQRLVGSNLLLHYLTKEFILPLSPSRILDIGCGTAKILDFLPHTVTYFGFDISKEYIRYAKKKYGGDKLFFYNERVSEMILKDTELFDIIITFGLLHHLNDQEAIDLFKIGKLNLKSNGVMITVDNTYFKGQSKIARFISSKDRGRHVRYPEGYSSLAETIFPSVEVIIRNNIGRIPQTVCILKCSNNLK